MCGQATQGPTYRGGAVGGKGKAVECPRGNEGFCLIALWKSPCCRAAPLLPSSARTAERGRGRRDGPGVGSRASSGAGKVGFGTKAGPPPLPPVFYRSRARDPRAQPRRRREKRPRRGLLPWPQGTFDVKLGDHSPHPPHHQLPFSTCPLDDVMDVRGPDRPPVGWSRL